MIWPSGVETVSLRCRFDFFIKTRLDQRHSVEKLEKSLGELIKDEINGGIRKQRTWESLELDSINGRYIAGEIALDTGK